MLIKCGYCRWWRWPWCLSECDLEKQCQGWSLTIHPTFDMATTWHSIILNRHWTCKDRQSNAISILTQKNSKFENLSPKIVKFYPFLHMYPKCTNTRALIHLPPRGITLRRDNYYMQVYSEGLATMPGVSNLAPIWRHYETKSNEGSCIVYITEKAALQHAQNTTFGYSPQPACLAWLAQWLVSHPLVFIHLRSL